MEVYVSDVGDGLCMSIDTGEVIQVDCGSSEYFERAFNGWMRCIDYHWCGCFRRRIPRIFILSHFHVDHYNGLLYALHKPKDIPLPYIVNINNLQIKEVYFPALPKFKKNREFLECLIAMNIRYFGSKSGLPVYDFLETMFRINHSEPFNYGGVFKGYKINTGYLQIEFLWPPYNR